VEGRLNHPIIADIGILKISTAQAALSTMVHLNGRVDVESSPDLRDRLLELLLRQPSVVITVDLSGVLYMDTSGIATLIEALKIARHHKKSLCLQGLTGSVLRLFQATGVLALFESSGCRIGASEPKEP
jgi:anti-sigma B factor antagonist